MSRRWVPRFSLRMLLLLVMLSGSGATLWWRWEPWVLEHTLPSFDLSSSVRFTDNGKLISVGYDGATIFDLWTGQTSTWKPKFRISGFSPDDRLFASVFDGTGLVLVIYDARTGIELARPRGVSGPFSRMSWTKDGRISCVSNFDGNTWLLNSADGTVKLFIKSGAVYSAIAPNGTVFITAGKDENTARLRAVGTGDVLAQLENVNDDVTFSPDGKWIAAARQDASFAIWDVSTLKELWTVNIGSDKLKPYVWFSPDSKWVIVSGILDPCPRMWSVTSGTERVLDTKSRSWSINISEDGDRIITATGNDSAMIWDASRGTLLATLHRAIPAEQNVLWLPRAYFSPDGNRILFGGHNPTQIYYRRRPEYWWGLAWLPEFWMTIIFACAFVWSLWRDRARLHAG